jgi:hypothetical protein
MKLIKGGVIFILLHAIVRLGRLFVVFRVWNLKNPWTPF